MDLNSFTAFSYGWARYYLELSFQKIYLEVYLPWMQKLPGGLIHVNIVGCALFAAISGSSAATVATVGKMSIPELRKRNYPEKILLGSLAGSGTLGLLIPPSIILIIYGVAVQESIAKLFIAGIIPGIMIALIFMSYVVIWSLINKKRYAKHY